MEYRPVPDARRPEMVRLLRYAFSIEEGPADGDDLEDHPLLSVGEDRGLFDGDDLVSVCRHIPFTASVRGDQHPLAGVSAVATPPEFRRRGLVRRVLAESLAEYRDRGWYLSALWPFDYAFYRQFGWAAGSRSARIECPPGALAAPAADEARGRLERVEAGGYEALVPVHEAHGAAHELTVRRTERWWRDRTFGGWGTDPYVYAWAGPGGDYRGYLRYTVDDGTLDVSELAHADREAERHLFRFLRDHDSQVDAVRLRVPPSPAFLDRVEDPRAVDYSLHQGAMVRLAAVAPALEALDYGDATGAFTLAVADPLASWNDATVRIEVDDGAATVERVADAPGEADVETDVGTLSQVYVGHHSVQRAVRVGGLEADGAVRPLLEAMFPERTPYLRERF